MASANTPQGRAFLNFIEQQGYKAAIHELIGAGEATAAAPSATAAAKAAPKRLLLNLDDLRSYDADFTRDFVRSPAEYLPSFEIVLHDVVQTIDPSYAKTSHASQFRIGVVGSFGSHHVSPRGLQAPLLNTLVRVEGIVTKCSLVRPKVVTSKHWCPTTKKFTSKDYKDGLSLDGTATGSAYPTKDADGNLLETEYGMSQYIDHQSIHLQEMPERAPPGQLPRSIEVILEGDLVDTAKPGDRLLISGILRALPSKASTSGSFKTVVLGNHVRLLTKQLGSSQFTEEDVKHIKHISRRDDALDLLAESLAPSVFGHPYEKRALLLMLLGGTERNLANGTHLRGDINVLMLGDPSTAKSQLLRAVMRTAPLAVSTTGRGSSGVGLTAAVTTDEETGNRRLEAGAMVLADRGVCCVDEFDKMLDADRVAIHEVMEQQTVTISKAGIHASLNARCSVVAAANPVFGTYDASMTPMMNIGMPDSLLSRFDLLFIILDKKQAESDRRISGHVLRQHCSAQQAAAALTSVLEGGRTTKEDEGQTSEVWLKSRTAVSSDDATMLTSDFMKKYIHYAKVKCAPQMSDEAAEHIAEAYATLRSDVAASAGKTLPVTARTLETMIRLSSAHAKCRLRGLVTKQDAEQGIALLKYALLSEETARAHREDPLKGGDGSDDDDDDDDDDDGNLGGAGGDDAGIGSASEDSSDDDDADAADEPEKLATRVQKVLVNDFFTKHRDAVPIKELLHKVQARQPGVTEEQVTEAVLLLERADKLMLRRGVVHEV